MGKGDVRAAAERLERGIERYGEGDLVAAAVEFEEAIQLAPEHARARQYLSWVKDVLAGTRGSVRKKELDEDAVRAVTEALDAGEDAHPEAPWNPVPIAPPNRHPSSPMNTIPYGLDEAAAASSGYKQGTAPTELAVEIPNELTGKSPSSATILGMAPPRQAILRPVSDERPESVTREFARGSPTLHNLPPLDVPELTEDQVAELISLESTLPTTGPGGRSLGPDLAATPDLPTEQRVSFVEFEAEATPPPHRAQPSLKLAPLPLDFDPLEMTPTHALESQRPRLNPLPVDEPVPDANEEEVTQNPTNPFIRSKLADYAYPEDSEELTRLPTGKRPSPKPSIADIMSQAKRVLAGGDVESAIDIADDVVTAAGGVDAEACLPFLSLLETIYTAVIGTPDQTLRHGNNVPDLDPRAAFLLSRIDGNIAIDDLLEVSGMPRLEAMRVLALLIRHGAVVPA